jgi:hypothetical protein
MGGADDDGSIADGCAPDGFGILWSVGSLWAEAWPEPPALANASPWFFVESPSRTWCSRMQPAAAAASQTAAQQIPGKRKGLNEAVMEVTPFSV